MSYFDIYRSNTLGGSGNQCYFTAETEQSGRIFFKIYAGGEYCYSFLFSNSIDSTYADGSLSKAGDMGGTWQITAAQVAVCDTCDNTVEGFVPLTFAGQPTKTVIPGEQFSNDPVKLSVRKDQYLCLQLSYVGEKIPYHEESILPTFVFEQQDWQIDKRLPAVSMVGCDRPVDLRIGFLGDSITQGIGTDVNSYAHWNARLAEKLPSDIACWNLGIGYGRASDAAQDGAWLNKAKQNDVVVVCFGVNDILNGRTAEQLKTDLKTIVQKLQQAGAAVLVQTIPPFNYEEPITSAWKEVNEYIITELSGIAEAVFDVVPLLMQDESHPQNAKYGAHPNAEGCAVWADALCPAINALIKRKM